MPLILDMEEENVPITPCFSSEGINYMHIRHNNLYREWSMWRSLLWGSWLIEVFPAVVALSKRNSNAVEIILFLHRLCAVSSANIEYRHLYPDGMALFQVLTEYFKEVEEESIRDNFVIIYELLDEMMDFGYPQTTESKILQE